MGFRTRAIGVVVAVTGVTFLALALGYDIIAGNQLILGAWQLAGAFLGLVLAVVGVLLIRRKSLLRIDAARVLVLCLSVLFTLPVGEFAVRYMHKAPPFDNAIVNVQNLPPEERLLRWHFYPKSTLGAYGPADDSDPGCRVLLLGDSVTGGLDVEAIAGHLSTARDDSRPVTLVRMGNAGHTTYQELEFLRIIGLESRPRLVVLGIVLNDVYYKYLHRPTNSRFLDAEPSVRLNRFNTDEFPGTVFAKSYLAHDLVYSTQVLWKRLTGSPDFEFERHLGAYLAWKDYGWKETDALIGEMQQVGEHRRRRVRSRHFSNGLSGQ